MVHNLIITGVGGQGTVLASHVVAAAAVESGFLVAVGETFGASQRGGSVTSHVRISRYRRYGPLIPRHRATIIVGFEPLETLRALLNYGNPLTRVIMNLHPNYPLGVLSGADTYPETQALMEAVRRISAGVLAFNATEIAHHMGSPVAANMVMTGALAGSELLPMAVPAYEKVIGELFSGPARQLNLKAFRAGVLVARGDLPAVWGNQVVKDGGK
ncbi:indolepyruvate oxidoreductase subunit beta [Desulfovirgula thermocuniculi]|uniref:indolepyruvate oxidoreductase subunit beta n=1 Tax=Desulfovirgula thermocuniculi TaxID=348842 RepID=UPI0004048C45|nr:indolepyruvate oxidoreductase subunit beta [Desulfovirgula thermocuniculi]